MKTWTTEVWMAAAPALVFERLTEPDAIARWAPMPFQVLELDGDRLHEGVHARVRGGLAGRQLEFDVEVLRAQDGKLSLIAYGPVTIGADYLVRPAGRGSSVRAAITISSQGIIGAMLAGALEALLAAGALRDSVARIGRGLEAIPA